MRFIIFALALILTACSFPKAHAHGYGPSVGPPGGGGTTGTTGGGPDAVGGALGGGFSCVGRKCDNVTGQSTRRAPKSNICKVVRCK